MHRGACVPRKIMDSSPDLSASIRRFPRNKSMKSWLHIERHCEFSELIIVTYEHVLTGWIIQALICPMCMPACAGTLFGFVILRLPRHVRDASFSKLLVFKTPSHYLSAQVRSKPLVFKCMKVLAKRHDNQLLVWGHLPGVFVHGCFSLWLTRGWMLEGVADVQMCVGGWDAATAS